MKEYVTEGIVLYQKPLREFDRMCDVYTKHLGRIEARVVGGRKILSKFASHLDSLNLVRLRLVEKNQLTITDAVTENRFVSLRRDGERHASVIRLFSFLRTMLPFRVPDARLWHFLLHGIREGTIDGVCVLRALGYDPSFAHCIRCGKKNIACFSAEESAFLCSWCAAKTPEQSILEVLK